MAAVARSELDMDWIHTLMRWADSDTVFN